MGKGKNILSNESLEIWTPPDAPPQGRRLGGQGPVVARHSGRLKHGKYSLRLSTLLRRGHAVLDQPLPAENYVGKTLILGAWVTCDKELRHVQILDFVGEDHKVSSACVEDSGKGDGEIGDVIARKSRSLVSFVDHLLSDFNADFRNGKFHLKPTGRTDVNSIL